MKQFITLLCLASLILTSCNSALSGSNSPEKVTTRAEHNRMTELEMPGEILVTILPYVLDSGQRVSVSRLDAKPSGDEGTFLLPGTIYEIDASQEVFSAPIEITLQYQEQLIPNDRTEAEVFAVFLYEGRWISVPGIVDEDANTITVNVIHASVWTWAIDKLENAVGAVQDFFGVAEVEQVPVTIQEAEALIRQREQEFWVAMSILEYEQAEYENELGFSTRDEVAILLIEYASETYLHEIAKNAVGAKFLIATAGKNVIGVLGLVSGALHLFEVSESSGELLAEMVKVEQAYDRLMAARAELWILEHPDVMWIPPAYLESVQRDDLGTVRDNRADADSGVEESADNSASVEDDGQLFIGDQPVLVLSVCEKDVTITTGQLQTRLEGRGESLGIKNISIRDEGNGLVLTAKVIGHKLELIADLSAEGTDTVGMHSKYQGEDAAFAESSGKALASAVLDEIARYIEGQLGQNFKILEASTSPTGFHYRIETICGGDGPVIPSGPQAVVCPSALPTRVRVGMTIRVTTSGKVDKLGIRPEPDLDSKKSFELLSGEQMSVVDGPACADESYFWYIHSAKGDGWVREGNPEFYFVDPLQ